MNAIQEVMRLAAQEVGAAIAEWKKRASVAQNAISLPSHPYRIYGDVEAGRWYVESAKTAHSEIPKTHISQNGGYEMLRMAMLGGLMHPGAGMDDGERADYIQRLKTDNPVGEVVWERIDPETTSCGEYSTTDRDGFFTFKDAREWLTDYLKPVIAEPVYFAADGTQAKS